MAHVNVVLVNQASLPSIFFLLFLFVLKNPLTLTVKVKPLLPCFTGNKPTMFCCSFCFISLLNFNIDPHVQLCSNKIFFCICLSNMYPNVSNVSMCQTQHIHAWGWAISVLYRLWLWTLSKNSKIKKFQKAMLLFSSWSFTAFFQTFNGQLITFNEPWMHIAPLHIYVENISKTTGFEKTKQK